MIASKAKRFNQLSKNEINQIFKLVSFNGIATQQEDLIPPKRTIDKLLTAFYANKYGKLNKLHSLIYSTTSPCSGCRADVDIRGGTGIDSKDTPVIEPNTGIESKDIGIIDGQYARNETESRLETGRVVNSFTRGGTGEKTE
jgi:hypothetical protein